MPSHIRIFKTIFGDIFAPGIAFVFYHTGLNWWKQESKITVFIALVVVPALIALFHFVVSFFKKEEKEEK